MVNKEKTALMTKLALYESIEGKEDIKLGRYYKGDYVRFQVLKTIVAATIGYLLVLLLVVIYHSEYLIANAVKLDYATMIRALIGFYIVTLTVFIAGAVIGYSLKYTLSRKKLAVYFRMLRRLRRFYKEEEETTASAERVDMEDMTL